MEPADFYTGIVAELYAPLRAFTQDPEPYVQFIRDTGEPALELGCGDGDPLLDLRRRGIDVEGVDSSADMLERCHRRADEEGLDVVLHHQKMESLDLPRRYRAIFLAGPTFTLLPDDDSAAQALEGIRAHLEQGGTALVPLFIPPPTPAEQLGRVREKADGDGAALRVTALSEERDEDRRLRRTTLRYERHTPDERTAVDRQWDLHWHTQDGFRDLARAAGLVTTAIRDPAGHPAATDATEFTFELGRR
ncbi:class I SAM-dependent methyltransferase [Phytoactinopolyspora endophytica]|uniref:class I SAM-dependent methyltransferase n=1 Tax=Phytoactinopolyspora endophytica TaxID=1642495 RepID=UPI00101D94E4|nr:class I SAM-dependent methyltransferase [Phytoactinopolyspora endophytica]